VVGETGARTGARIFQTALLSQFPVHITGLQSRLHQFDSGRRLLPHYLPGVLLVRGLGLASRPGHGRRQAGGIPLLFVLDEFDGAEPGAWIARTTRMFAWLAPGEVKIFAPADLETAKAGVRVLSGDRTSFPFSVRRHCEHLFV